MKTLDRSDLWVGAVVAALFALVVAVFYGPLASRMWPQLLAYTGILWIVSLIRRPISKLGRAPRFAVWFCIGTAAGSFFPRGDGQGFTVTGAVSFGLGLAIGDFIGEWFAARKAARMADL